jgi:5'(3')-deoxyribonucleotidase
MRPQLLIDADGVLVDFTKTTLDIVQDLTGVRVDPKSITTWEVFERLPVELQARKEEVYDIIRGEGVCRAMAALECAEAGLDSISGIADITVVTSPFRPSRTWVHERDEWLWERFPYLSGVIHTKHKHMVHGDVFVDDKKRHVDAWRAYWDFHGHPGDVFTGIWWNNAAGLEEAARWNKLYDIIEELGRTKRAPV